MVSSYLIRLHLCDAAVVVIFVVAAASNVHSLWKANGFCLLLLPLPLLSSLSLKMCLCDWWNLFLWMYNDLKSALITCSFEYIYIYKCAGAVCIFWNIASTKPTSGSNHSETPMPSLPLFSHKTDYHFSFSRRSYIFLCGLMPSRLCHRKQIGFWLLIFFWPKTKTIHAKNLISEKKNNHQIPIWMTVLCRFFFLSTFWIILNSCLKRLWSVVFLFPRPSAISSWILSQF